MENRIKFKIKKLHLMKTIHILEEKKSLKK